MLTLTDNLIGHHALVTGASKGIGLAVSRDLLARGINVTGVARDFSSIKTEFKDIESSANTFTSLACDLSKLDALEKSLTTFPTQANTLILNAGYGQFGALEQFSNSQIRQLVDTNLISNLLLCKYYLPPMKRSGGGDIVIVGSESSMQGAKAGAIYCATKFALRGLAQSLRADCSTANIRVHLINPGPVDSDFFADLKFTPQAGQEFCLNPGDVASAVIHVLEQPRHVVSEELNLQPMKRSFVKK